MISSNALQAILLFGTLVGNTLATDASLGIECPAGKQPGILHTFVGEYDVSGPKSFDASTTQALSKQFNKVLRFMKRKASLPVSAVSTAEDADPSSEEITAGFFGAYLMFTESEKRPSKTAVAAMETYWPSAPHLAFYNMYLDTLNGDDESGVAATFQMLTCAPEGGKSDGLGKYHVALLIDLVPGNEKCADIVLNKIAKLNTLDPAAFAADASFCGKQWSDWDSLSFADTLANIDRAKKNGDDNVGCMFNFNTRNTRDQFVKLAGEQASELNEATEGCIEYSWIWKME